ncbi:hypothetical protein VTO42DRAFT_2309 [Malbranchea cinnamomea]
MADDEATLNIPSILTLAVVSFFFIRWFLSSRSSAGDGQQPRGRRVDPAQVEQISQMFPQLSRREIMWDLHRNGGSVAATTERILSGRGLDTPPPSYQPMIPQPAPQPHTATASSSSASKPQTENLITRYNLEDRIKAEGTGSDAGSDLKPESGWSQNRSERQRLLQKRRDDMILAARRKLLEKEQAAKNS